MRLFFFYLTFQTEKKLQRSKELIFRYKLTQNANANFNVHALVLYDEEVVIDKVGNELVIV